MVAAPACRERDDCRGREHWSRWCAPAAAPQPLTVIWRSGRLRRSSRVERAIRRPAEPSEEAGLRRCGLPRGHQRASYDAAPLATCGSTSGAGSLISATRSQGVSASQACALTASTPPCALAWRGVAQDHARSHRHTGTQAHRHTGTHTHIARIGTAHMYRVHVVRTVA